MIPTLIENSKSPARNIASAYVSIDREKMTPKKIGPMSWPDKLEMTARAAKSFPTSREEVRFAASDWRAGAAALPHDEIPEARRKIACDDPDEFEARSA